MLAPGPRLAMATREFSCLELGTAMFTYKHASLELRTSGLRVAAALAGPRRGASRMRTCLFGGLLSDVHTCSV